MVWVFSAYNVNVSGCAVPSYANMVLVEIVTVAVPVAPVMATLSLPTVTTDVSLKVQYNVERVVLV